MSKLRFCLAGEYPLDVDHIGGGVPHVLYMLGETFRDRDDIEFSIVSPAKGLSGVEVVSKPGVKIHYVGAPKRRIVPNLLVQGSRVAPVLADIRPDVVNSHHCTTTEAAVRAGCKVVHTIHGVIHKEVRFAGRQHRLARYLHSMLEKRAISSADAVMAVAQYGLDEYRPWIKSSGYTMPVPIEDVFWDVPPMDEGRSVLFAGAVSQRKNLIVLIRAMVEVVKRYADAVLHVCGPVVEPQYMARVQSVINARGMSDSINFCGTVDRTRLATILSESCALVLPSYQESSPGVICQAMGAGRVPIASPVGGIPEMIEDGVTGFLVEPDDSETLAARLIELMDDFDKAQRMGAAARDIALARYDRHHVADRILSICSSLVHEREEALVGQSI